MNKSKGLVSSAFAIVYLLTGFGLNDLKAQTVEPGRVILPASFRVEVAQKTDPNDVVFYELSLDEARFGLSVNNTTRYLFFEFDISPLEGKNVCGVRLRVFNHGRANTIHRLNYAPLRPKPLFPNGGLLLFGSASAPEFSYRGDVELGEAFEWSVYGDDQWSPSPGGFFPEDPYQMILWRRDENSTTIVEDLNRHLQDPDIDWFGLRFSVTGAGEGRVNLRFDETPKDPASMVLEVLTMDIDLLEAQNAAFHHTGDYELEDTLVVRRAPAGQQPVKEQQLFEVGLTTGLPINRSKMKYQLEAVPLFDSPEEKIIIPEILAGAIKSSQWGMKILEEGSEKKVVINIPPDAAVGKYRFKFQAFLKDALQQPLCEVPFKKDILVLFNPWSALDRRVHLNSETGLNALLLDNNEDPPDIIYMDASSELSPDGNLKPNEIEWVYAQFHATTVEVALSLLEQIGPEARKDPYRLARDLAPYVNAADGDGGIVVGSWDGNYVAGLDPLDWEGSLDILEFYKASGPVKYGQCWVFTGVLISLLRSLGIPCRPVTCWNSGWEQMAPFDKHLDIRFVGEKVDLENSDYVWGHHVWAEAWLSFDEQAAAYWHVLDATPMNPSLEDGRHRIGPAFVPDILATDLPMSGMDYDVDFVDMEVDGVVVRHNDPINPGPDPNFLGEAIWAANIAGLPVNIASNYKIPNQPSKSQQGKTLANAEIEAIFTSPRNGTVGEPVTWSVTLTNHAKQSRDIKITQVIRNASYRGDLFEILDEQTLIETLASGEIREVSLSVPEAGYLAFVSSDNYLYGSTWVESLDTNEIAFSDSKLGLSGPDLIFTTEPEPAIIQVGDTIDFEVAFTNPLSVPLTDVTVRLSLSGSILGFGPERRLYITWEQILPGETVVYADEAVGFSAGEDSLLVTITSNEVFPFKGSTDMEVYADCNGNGVPDHEDLDLGTSQDCNKNGIPDECDLASGTSTDVNGNGLPDGCETDCNRNYIPDTWELQQGLVEDCNGNGIPDSCDITGIFEEPVSTDLNLNRIPDECEPDCNGNGIPDDYEIAQGAAADCNGNGLPDECDIASQNSGDTDNDGVPDECEQPQMTQPAPGSHLGAAEVTFQWDGTNAPFLNYRLDVGSTAGGSDLFAGSPLGQVQSQTVPGLPVDGRAVFVRLHYLLDTTWGYIDTTYTAVRLALLTAPMPGTQLGGPDPVFAWTGNGLAVDEWQLDLGSSSGANDLYQSGPLAGAVTSHAVIGLPTDGRPIWARLRYTIGVATDEVVATYTAAQLPEITSPAPGSTLASDSAAFQWVDNGASVTDWQLLVGTAQGGTDLFNSGVLPAGTDSQTVTGLPLDGSTLWVRLRYRIDGTWSQRDVSYTTDRQAQITAPTDHQLTADSATFQWTANGLNISQWRLEIGSDPGTNDIYQSGVLSGATLSQTVTGLPVDGRLLRVRLSYKRHFTWLTADTTYRALGEPVIVAPAPGGTLPGFATRFEMDPRGMVLDYWQIKAGSTQGAQNYFASSTINGSVKSTIVSNLPTDGSTVWIRFRYRINGIWHERDYQYTATSVPGGPTFTEPVPGSTLPGFATLFTYTSDGGVIDEWKIHAGSTKGASDYYHMTQYLGGQVHSFIISNLPTDGSTVWMQLRYRINGNWYERDFQYTASSVPGGPTFTDPVPGSTLPGFGTRFTYTSDGGVIDEWKIHAGSTKGASDYYHMTQYLGGQVHSFIISNLPTDGSTVWMQLRYRINGNWYERDFQYTASSIPGGPTFSDPVPGSTLPGETTTFTYTKDGGVIDQWQIYAGSTQGASDYYRTTNYVGGQTLFINVSNLPTDGSTVWVQLRYKINGNWYERDFQYIAFGEPSGPTITDPIAGSTLPGPTANVTFTANGENVEFWQLYAGSTIGGSEHGTSTTIIGTATTATLTTLPTDGSTVYIQLRYRIGGTWYWRDFTYTAATAIPK